MAMQRDVLLRRSLVALAAAVAVVGLLTFSFRKMLATYGFGILGIAGILLPDWEFFDRDFKLWFTPMTAARTAGGDRADEVGRFKFKFYPLRVTVLTVLYCFGLHKWWKIMST